MGVRYSRGESVAVCPINCRYDQYMIIIFVFACAEENDDIARPGFRNFYGRAVFSIREGYDAYVFRGTQAA